MRFLLPLLLAIGALPCSVYGQQFRGRIFDGASSRPLATVLVTNTRSGALWVSDSAGNIAFTAYPGDVVSFQHPAYHDRELRINSYEDPVSIALTKAPIQLAEVKVLSPLLRYRQDSIFNHQFFRKELGYASSKAEMNYSGGIGTSGLISELALSLSGKKKYYKRFAGEMAMLEELRYSSIRYTPEMVAAQTGLDDSAASAFILKHPMTNEFVRTASELELKMWVREQYRADQRRGIAAQHELPLATKPAAPPHSDSMHVHR